MIKSRPNPQEPRSQWSVILISSYLSQWVQIRASLLFILLGSLRRVHYILYTSHVKCRSAITISCQIDVWISINKNQLLSAMGLCRGRRKNRGFIQSPKRTKQYSIECHHKQKVLLWLYFYIEFDDLNSQLTGPTRHVSTWQEKHTGSE